VKRAWSRIPLCVQPDSCCTIMVGSSEN
jgi:hypothetical protein